MKDTKYLVLAIMLSCLAAFSCGGSDFGDSSDGSSDDGVSCDECPDCWDLLDYCSALGGGDWTLKCLDEIETECHYKEIECCSEYNSCCKRLLDSKDSGGNGDSSNDQSNRESEINVEYCVSNVDCNGWTTDHCYQGACAECTIDADCSTNSHVCVEGHCAYVCDPPDDPLCEGGMLVRRNCESDSDCPSSAVCEQIHEHLYDCVLYCNYDSECQGFHNGLQEHCYQGRCSNCSNGSHCVNDLVCRPEIDAGFTGCNP